jgi:transposase
MPAEVVDGAERWRRWSQDDKVRIGEDAPLPRAKVTDVARRYGIAASVVFAWRRQARTLRRPICSITVVGRARIKLI